MSYVVVISEEGYDLSNKSVNKAFEMMRKNNPQLLGEVHSVGISNSDSQKAINSICNAWDKILTSGDMKIPDYVLDLSTYGPGAETVNYFTLKLGIPTLTAEYGQMGDLLGWRENTPQQSSEYIIQFFHC